MLYAKKNDTKEEKGKKTSKKNKATKKQKMKRRKKGMKLKTMKLILISDLNMTLILSHLWMIMTFKMWKPFLDTKEDLKKGV